MFLLFSTACAHIFYQAGAKVILAARRIRELERVSKEIQATNVVSQIQDID